MSAISLPPEDIQNTLEACLLQGQRHAFQRSDLQKDHRSLLPGLFPDTFRAAFSEQQDKYWQHIWSIRDKQPVRSYVLPLPRGHGKSTGLEVTNVVVAGRKTRRHALYISATQTLANAHLASIEAKFGAKSVAEMYPSLGKPARTTIGTYRSWRSNVLTIEGYTIRSLGLDVPARGLKSFEDYRPDIVFLDEIDLLEDSAQEVLRKIDILRQSIFPMMALPYGVVLFGQNLIHPDSIMAQVVDGRASILSTAIIEDVIGAVEDLAYEEYLAEDERGVMRRRCKITGGTPTWGGYPLTDCQAFVDNSDIDAFLRECQQLVNRPKTGCLLSMFDERLSVITWDEFQAFYGKLATDTRGLARMPPVGFLGNYQDVGGTPEHPNTNLWLWRPELGMALSDSVFVYRELTLPEYPEVLTTDPSPLTVATAVHRLEAPWGEGFNHRMIRRISHEANTETRFYQIDLPKIRDDNTGQPMRALRYSQWDPQKVGGIGTLQSYMATLEGKHSEECPHRITAEACIGLDHVATCPHSGRTEARCWARPNPFRPHLWGRSRLYLIVDADQGALEGKRQRQPYNARGLIRLRAEIPRYTELKTHGGKAKIFDDAVDCLRKAAEEFFLPVAKPRDEDVIEAALPEQYRKDATPEVIAGLTDVARANLAQNSYYSRHNLKAQFEEKKKGEGVSSYFGRLRKYDRR